MCILLSEFSIAPMKKKYMHACTSCPTSASDVQKHDGLVFESASIGTAFHPV